MIFGHLIITLYIELSNQIDFIWEIPIKLYVQHLYYVHICTYFNFGVSIFHIKQFNYLYPLNIFLS